ncbi:hypothetical protein QFZ31_006674 [Neobacillus niacini]|uniref:hypothetical protein n=1 Tax=Neobacillus driksii TaxID=3035913 RepID=UPI0027896AEF|nr:hypothetical protein [Neobacillus niacini]MDQ0976622.1 hypothetical protein [Neobacillus niacini]
MIDYIYLTGSTVRLSATFTDIEGANKDPDLVKVVIYDYKFIKLEEFVLGVPNRMGLGEYVFDYTAPMAEKKIYFEFYGEIDGNPVLDRDSFTTKFFDR